MLRRKSTVKRRTESKGDKMKAPKPPKKTSSGEDKRLKKDKTQKSSRTILPEVPQRSFSNVGNV